MYAPKKLSAALIFVTCSSPPTPYNHPTSLPSAIAQIGMGMDAYYVKCVN